MSQATSEQRSDPGGRSRAERALRAAIAAGFKGGAAAAARLREIRPPRAPDARCVAALRVIAHRGASAYAPENTLPAFRLAVEQGAREVELDVQLARDGVLVVFHDDDLAVKTGRSGPVRQVDSADLRALEIGTWFDSAHPEFANRFAGTRLNTFAEILDSFGDTLHYHVELKSTDELVPDLVLEAIESRGLREHVTITSFRSEGLVRVRRLDPAISICQLVRRAVHLRESAMDQSLLQNLRTGALQRRALEGAASCGFDQVAFPAHELRRALVARARRLGLGVRAWRVRTEEDLACAVRCGVDGVTVDWPDRAWALLAQLQSEVAG